MTNSETNTAKTNLKQLIGQLIHSYQPVAVQQHSFFVNNISTELYTGTDPDTLNAMLGSLLYIIARCSKDSCILIDAIPHGNTMELSLKDNNAVNNYAVLYEFQHLKLLAQRLNGFLNINNLQNKETVISFSFDNRYEHSETGILRELKRA